MGGNRSRAQKWYWGEPELGGQNWADNRVGEGGGQSVGLQGL